MDIAIAAQLYAKQAKDPELINHATDIRRRAEREAGKKLAEMEKAKGGEQYHVAPSTGSTVKPVPTIRDIGVTKTQSSRWQKLAALPEKTFEAQVEASKRKAVASIDSANNAEMKRQHRADRERELTEKMLAAGAIPVVFRQASPHDKEPAPFCYEPCGSPSITGPFSSGASSTARACCSTP